MDYFLFVGMLVDCLYVGVVIVLFLVERIDFLENRLDFVGS